MRFERHYREVAESESPEAVIRRLSDLEVVEALAAASLHHDAYLSNVLATAARNRWERQHQVFDHLDVGVCATDARGRILFTNHALTRLLGWTSDELIKKDLHALTGCLGLSPDAECPIQEALRTGTPFRGFARYHTRVGGDTEAELTVVPVRRGEDVDMAVLAIHDPPETFHLLRGIAASLHGIGFVVYDLRGRIQLANQAAEDTLDPEQLRELARAHAVAEALQQGKGTPFRRVSIHAPRHPGLEAQAAAAPLRDPHSGERIGAVAAFFLPDPHHAPPPPEQDAAARVLESLGDL